MDTCTKCIGMLQEFNQYLQLLQKLCGIDELQKSAVTDKGRPSLNLHRLQVYRWFKSNGGKEKSTIEKMLLTSEHKAARLRWVDDWAEILKQKWFYTATARGRKIKFCPRILEKILNR